MSAQSNIVAYDGAATPVVHTLVPLGSVTDEKLGNVAKWREQLTTVPLYAQIRVTTFEKRLRSGVNRVEIRVEIPVMESVTGANAAGYTAAPKVAFTDSVSFVGFFSDRSAIANRRLAKQLLTNILSNIATSVAAPSVGVASELVDSGITAS